MGIYVLRTDRLSDVLTSEGDDFCKDIISKALVDYGVMGQGFDDYWADIGIG